MENGGIRKKTSRLYKRSPDAPIKTSDVSMVVGINGQAFLNSLVSAKRLEITKNTAMEKRLRSHSLLVMIDGHSFYVDPLELYRHDPESYRRYLELTGDDVRNHM